MDYFDSGSDSEDERRELEALLYSQIHHEEHPDESVLTPLKPVSQSRLEEDPVEVTPVEVKDSDDEKDKAGHSEVEVVPVDSGVSSLRGSESCSPVNGGKNLNPVIISLDDSLSSSSDDEGIQVLAEPERTKKGFDKFSALRNRSNIDEDEDDCEVISDSDEIEIEEIGRGKSNYVNKFEAVKKKPAKSDIASASTKPVSPKRTNKAKITVEETPKTKSKPNKVIVFSDSSSSSDEYDSDTLLDNNITLNILGSATPRNDNVSLSKIIGKTPADQFAPVPEKWSVSMASYYNDIDEEVGNTDVKELFDALPDEANWKIDRADLYRDSGSPFTRGGSRYYNRKRCSNCNRPGHLQKDCPEPKKASCNTCGEEDHLKYNCPRMMCLRCGQAGESYTRSCGACRNWERVDCRLCGAPGHTRSHCQDNWRRYHATTSDETGIVVPDVDVHKSAKELHCLNCSKKGHYLHQCRAYRYSPFPFPFLSVVSYKETQSEGDLGEGTRSKREQRRELKAMKKAYRANPNAPVNQFFTTVSKMVNTKKYFNDSDLEVVNDRGDDIAESLMSNATGKDRWKLKRKEMKTESKKRRREEAAKPAKKKRVETAKPNNDHQIEFQGRRGFRKSPSTSSKKKTPQSQLSPLEKLRHVSAGAACAELGKVGKKDRGKVKEAIRRLKQDFQPMDLLPKKRKKRLSDLLKSIAQ